MVKWFYRHPLQEQPEPFQENVIASTDNFVELNQTETEKLSSDGESTFSSSFLRA